MKIVKKFAKKEAMISINRFNGFIMNLFFYFIKLKILHRHHPDSSSGTMDWTKWSERPTEVYVGVLRKEGASDP